MASLRPASGATSADWLLSAAQAGQPVIRFGPPRLAVHLRVAFDFDEQGRDRSAGACFDVLAGHTATPERCYAAVWEGWTSGGRRPTAPLVEMPHRTMLLFETEVGGLLQAPAVAWGEADGLGPPPHLAWPSDRTWVFACDVDEDVELAVGCSELAAADLEAALPAQVRRTSYAAPAPLWRDEVWPLRAVADHPLNDG